MKGKIVRFELPFYNGRHRLKIVLHPNLTSLQKAWREKDHRPARGTRAFFSAPPKYTVSVPSMSIREKCLGEIHLCEGRIGSGVWAHELQHFVSNWTNAKSWGCEDPHFEKIADIVQELTVRFWREYFRLHPEYAPRSEKRL